MILQYIFFINFHKIFKTIPDGWFIVICWSSLLFGTYDKKFVEFNVTSFGSLKYDCVIKVSEILSCQSLINR